MVTRSFESFEDLLQFLRDWRTWQDDSDFDFGGMVHLLGACLTAIGTNALDAEIEDFSDFLGSEKETLLRLASVLRNSS